MKAEDKDARTLTIKKSNMTAREEDFPKLQQAVENALPCKIHEQEEELEFVYDIRHMKCLDKLRKEDKLLQISVLSNIYLLEKLRERFEFSMEPGNLYYDYRSNVYVMHKDVISDDYSGKQDHFVEEYKSLIGYVLQKRYNYEDYLKGGQSLLKKQEFLNRIYGAKDVDAITKLLETHYEEVLDIKCHQNIELKRSKYRSKNIYITVASLLLAAAAGVLGYLYFYQIKAQSGILKVYDSYIIGDYVAAIDASQNIRLSDMNSRQKYALAVSYVKSEDLTTEQKDNILALLFPEGDEKLLDYWIQLGRLNVTEAENIAMQCSDDELLLYAYLKEKKALEADMELTGTQKSEAMEALQGKIDSLSGQYTTEEEGNADE